MAAGRGGLLAAAATRAGLLAATRDFQAFHQMLFDAGLAVRAGEPLAPPKGAVPDDLPAVVARISGLIDARRPSRRPVRCGLEPPDPATIDSAPFEVWTKQYRCCPCAAAATA